jgi:hypothetical protein
MIRSKFKENRQFRITYNLTLIHRQFCPNLALANHTPHEVMRLPGILFQKSEKSL